jgi:hypothetical protein
MTRPLTDAVMTDIIFDLNLAIKRKEQENIIFLLKLIKKSWGKKGVVDYSGTDIVDYIEKKYINDCKGGYSIWFNKTENTFTFLDYDQYENELNFHDDWGVLDDEIYALNCNPNLFLLHCTK